MSTSKLIKKKHVHMDKAQDFKDKKYILLETYKKDNTAVQTPVWFVMLDETIHVVTREDTGKVKRLQNNKSVRIALCTFNGRITGKWVSGTAKFVTYEKSNDAIDLRKKKYGFLESVARLVSKKKGNLFVFSLELE